MKRLLQEDGKEDKFEDFIGHPITVFCVRYFYTGYLSGVSDKQLELTDAKLVYETGRFDEKDWKDAQPIAKVWCIERAAIESWGLLK